MYKANQLSNLEKKEIVRLKNLCLFENKLREKGYNNIAGVDEVGRGPLAGPVVAAACIIPKGVLIEGIDDSKKIESSKREEVFQRIINHPKVSYSVGIVDNKVIDQINILQASFLAMKQAIRKLLIKPDFLLFDGNQYPMTSIPSNAIVKGDSLSISIAAASIIAKQTRDKIMEEYHIKWPHFGFDQHKGYATEKHRNAIVKHGPCEIHRRSFDPIKSLFF